VRFLVVDIECEFVMENIFDVLENLVSNCLRNTLLFRTKLGKEGRAPTSSEADRL